MFKKLILSIFLNTLLFKILKIKTENINLSLTVENSETYPGPTFIGIGRVNKYKYFL